MGNRLTKIYTRTGDDGTTGLGDGSRTAKNSLRVAAMGDIDELNSQLGMLIALLPSSHAVYPLLTSIQHRLFDLGGELSIPHSTLLQASEVTLLENAIDRWNADLPPLKNFIMPGGSLTASQCHISRAICRRAERSVTALAQEELISNLGPMYLNRLSDLLFVLARVFARQENGSEVLWEPSRSPNPL